MHEHRPHRGLTARGSAPGDPLTLAHYAAVAARIAEGFALAEILRAEAISEDAWAAARQRYLPALAKDSDLLAQYEALLAIEADALGRRVEPLETDLDAWVAFLRGDVARIMARAGLTSGDLGRLHRRWARCFGEDADLRKRAEALAGTTEPAALPSISVAASVLGPSSHARVRAGPGYASPLDETAATLDPDLLALAALPFSPPLPADRRAVPLAAGTAGANRSLGETLEVRVVAPDDPLPFPRRGEGR